MVQKYQRTHAHTQSQHYVANEATNDRREHKGNYLNMWELTEENCLLKLLTVILLTTTVPLPLEGALHLLLLLVGFFDLVGDPGQELFKVEQQVGLIPSELGPETAHLAWTAATATGT